MDDDEFSTNQSEWPGDELIPVWLRPEDPDDIEPSRTADRFRRTTAGMMLGAAGLAIRELLTAPREEAPIEVEAPGTPPGSRGMDVELDPDDPAASVVVLRTDLN